MNTAVKLIITNFDNSENDKIRALIYQEYYFISEENIAAEKACLEFLNSLTMIYYRGHNNEIYPKFDMQRIVFTQAPENTP